MDEIKRFVSEECAIPVEKLRAETRLFHDLGLDGDDAREFLRAFANQFQVDIQDLEFDKYFGEEAAINPVFYFYWLIFSPGNLKKTPVSLKHLQRCVAEGRWTAPDEAPV